MWRDRVRRLATDPVVMRSRPATNIYVKHCLLINTNNLNLRSWLLAYQCKIKCITPTLFSTLILIFETLFPFVSGELRPELPFMPSFSNISSTVGSIMHLLQSLPELLTREAEYGVYDAREFQHTFVYRETLMAMNNSQDLTCALGSVLKASNCGMCYLQCVVI